jgi:hypothetical protein
MSSVQQYYVPNTPNTAGFCKYCLRLAIPDPDVDRTGFWHHSSFSDLAKSADSGCKLCALFRTVVLEYTAQRFSTSLDGAIRHHEELDLADRSKLQGRSAFIVNLVLYDIAAERGNQRRRKGILGLVLERQAMNTSRNVNDTYPFVDVLSETGASSAFLCNGLVFND